MQQTAPSSLGASPKASASDAGDAEAAGRAEQPATSPPPTTTTPTTTTDAAAFPTLGTAATQGTAASGVQARAQALVQLWERLFAVTARLDDILAANNEVCLRCECLCTSCG
jgi:hypothetical protein